MLSSRHVVIAWLVIGALTLPVACANLPGSLSASRASAVDLGFASGVVANVSSQARLPSIRPGASAPADHTASSGSTQDAASTPSIASGTGSAPASAEVLAGWDALHLGQNGGITDGSVPPDVIVSAGPDHVVEMVNLMMGVYTKQGAVVGITSLVSLFNSGGDFVSDPKVQYDVGSGRWFASLTDVTSTQVLLAVSGSSDPAGSWRVFHVPASATGNCLDQPILGVGTSTVILSVNVFTQTNPSTCVSPFLGAEYWVLNKTELVTGASPLHIYDSGLDLTEFSIHPAQMEGSSATHYMVSTYWPGTATTSNVLHLFTVSGVPPDPVTVTIASFPMPTAAVPPSADQLGSRGKLDTGDIRVSDAVWSAGKLWLGFDEACQSAASRACIRLIELDTAATSMPQDFDIDVTGTHVFYPGLRMDGVGDLAVVFGYSSSNDYPGIMAEGRLTDDSPNTLAAAQIIVTGTGPEVSGCSKSVCRYGDYFGAGLDPSNTSVVWLAGEMGTPSGWSTHVFSVSQKAMRAFSYAVIGGGTGYTGPAVSYVENGVRRQTVLTSGSNALLIDPGTQWSIDTQLPGSSPGAGQIWTLNTSAGPPFHSDWANSSFVPPYAFLYFHQYAASLDYSVVGGSGSPIAPNATGVVFQTAQTFDLPFQGFLDAGTTYSYPSGLGGSTATERWQAGSDASGSVSAPLNLTLRYYHQDLVTFAFAVQGPVPASGPHVAYSSLGGAASVTANATVWVDSGSAYSYDSALSGASSTVRWGPNVDGNGTVTVPGTILVTYHRQFLISVLSDPSALASAVSGAGWYDAGATATLAVTAPSGWRFHGWSGGASGNSTTITIPVQAPMNLTALFDAGLTIAAGDGGSVSYSFGSTSGTVPAGTSTTIYVPVGTTVTLVGTPGSWSQTFAGWSGAASGTDFTTTVQVTAPGSASGSFGLSTVLVAGLALLVLVVVVVLVLIVLVRRRRMPPRT